MAKREREKETPEEIRQAFRVFDKVGIWLESVRISFGTKGRHQKKNWFFFFFRQKGGGGVSDNPKNPYQKILRLFWPKRGGSHPIQKGFIRFFGIICQKMGVLYKKLVVFWPFFAEKGGGLGRVKKILIRKNWGGQKRGRGGGVSVFWLKVKKNQFFFFWCLPLAVLIIILTKRE